MMGLPPASLVAFLLAAAITSSPAIADDDFSIAGTYVQNVACKGDGSDPKAKIVRITNTEIHSSFGICKFINKHRDGNTLVAQMSCNGEGGNVLLGEVSFTLRAERIIDFVDQDKTYRSTLYPCPQAGVAPERPQTTGNLE
jgi:hypothetical protein